MTMRTTQLFGRTEGCEIEIRWNDELAWSGDISARGSHDESVMLAEWMSDPSLMGSIPLSITCLFGELWFGFMRMSHVRPIWQTVLTEAIAWANYTPTAPELFRDLYGLTALSDDDLKDKYGIKRSQLQKNLTITEITPAETNITDPWLITVDSVVISDGKDDVEIDGLPQSRHNTTELIGPWHWQILETQTLVCRQRIEP